MEERETEGKTEKNKTLLFSESTSTTEDETSSSSFSDSEPEASSSSQGESDASTESHTAMLSLEDDEGSSGNASVSSVLIHVLGDNQCAFNAFILAAADSIVSGALDSEEDDEEEGAINKSFEKQKRLARETWIRFFNGYAIEEKDDWAWDDIKKYFKDKNTLLKQTRLQQQFAPLLRKEAIRLAEKNMMVFQQRTLPAFLAAYEAYYRGDRTEDIFRHCPKIQQLFEKLKKYKNQENALAVANTSWQIKYAKIFLVYMEKSTSWAGDIELALLAQTFGFALSVTAARFGEKPFLFEDDHGKIAFGNTKDKENKKRNYQLSKRGIVAGFKNTPTVLRLLRMKSTTLLERLDNIQNQTTRVGYGKIKNLSALKSNINNLDSETVRLLADRSILVRGNNGEYGVVSGIEDEEYQALINELPDKDGFREAWEAAYYDKPMLPLVNEHANHWEVLTNRDYLQNIVPFKTFDETEGSSEQASSDYLSSLFPVSLKRVGDIKQNFLLIEDALPLHEKTDSQVFRLLIAALDKLDSGLNKADKNKSQNISDFITSGAEILDILEGKARLTPQFIADVANYMGCECFIWEKNTQRQITLAKYTASRETSSGHEFSPLHIVSVETAQGYVLREAHAQRGRAWEFAPAYLLSSQSGMFAETKANPLPTEVLQENERAGFESLIDALEWHIELLKRKNKYYTFPFNFGRGKYQNSIAQHRATIKRLLEQLLVLAPLVERQPFVAKALLHNRNNNEQDAFRLYVNSLVELNEIFAVIENVEQVGRKKVSVVDMAEARLKRVCYAIGCRNVDGVKFYDKFKVRKQLADNNVFIGTESRRFLKRPSPYNPTFGLIEGETLSLLKDEATIVKIDHGRDRWKTRARTGILLGVSGGVGLVPGAAVAFLASFVVTPVIAVPLGGAVAAAIAWATYKGLNNWKWTKKWWWKKHRAVRPGATEGEIPGEHSAKKAPQTALISHDTPLTRTTPLREIPEKHSAKKAPQTTLISRSTPLTHTSPMKMAQLSTKEKESSQLKLALNKLIAEAKTDATENKATHSDDVSLLDAALPLIQELNKMMKACEKHLPLINSETCILAIEKGEEPQAKGDVHVLNTIIHDINKLRDAHPFLLEGNYQQQADAISGKIQRMNNGELPLDIEEFNDELQAFKENIEAEIKTGMVKKKTPATLMPGQEGFFATSTSTSSSKIENYENTPVFDNPSRTLSYQG